MPVIRCNKKERCGLRWPRRPEKQNNSVKLLDEVNGFLDVFVNLVDAL